MTPCTLVNNQASRKNGNFLHGRVESALDAEELAPHHRPCEDTYMPKHRRTGFYYIIKRSGEYLADMSRVPYRWSERDRLAFRTRPAALAALGRFGSGAREMCGIRIVQN